MNHAVEKVRRKTPGLEFFNIRGETSPKGQRRPVFVL